MRTGKEVLTICLFVLRSDSKLMAQQKVDAFFNRRNYFLGTTHFIILC